MQKPALEQAIEDLARAGEQAGISVEDMIRVLRAGVSVETLFDLVEWSLQGSQREPGLRKKPDEL
jgi:hypothetical protein